MAHTEIPKLSDFARNRKDTEGRKRFADALDRYHSVHERERLKKAKNFDKPPKKGPPRPKEGYVGPVYYPDTWRSKEALTEKRTVGTGRSKKEVTFYRVPGTNDWGGPNSYERTRQRSALFNALPPSIRDFNPNDLQGGLEAKLAKNKLDEEKVPDHKNNNQAKIEEAKQLQKNKFDYNSIPSVDEFNFQLGERLTAGEERAQNQVRGSVLKNKALLKNMRNEQIQTDFLNIPDMPKPNEYMKPGPGLKDAFKRNKINSIMPFPLNQDLPENLFGIEYSPFDEED